MNWMTDEMRLLLGMAGVTVVTLALLLLELSGVTVAP